MAKVKLTPVRKIPAYAVITRAVWERGDTQAEALAELDRRGLWLSDEQHIAAGLPPKAPRKPLVTVAARDMLAALKAMVATVDRAKGQPVTFFEGMRGCSVDKARTAIAAAEAAGIKAD